MKTEKLRLDLIVLSLIFQLMSSVSFGDRNSIITQQYLDGNYALLDTVNLPKARGMQIQLKYPEGWILEEGDRPNVVQKFKSPDKNGYIGMVLVVEFPKELIARFKDIGPKEEEEIFRELDVKDFVPQNSNYISSSATKFDGQSGYILDYTTQGEVAGQSIGMHTVNYMFIYRNWLATFQCASSGKTIDDASKKMESFRKVCQKIAISIVVPEKWKVAEAVKQAERMPEAKPSESNKRLDFSFKSILVMMLFSFPEGFMCFSIVYLSSRKYLFQIMPSYKRLFGMFLLSWVTYAIIFVLAGIETMREAGTTELLVPATLALLAIIIGRGKSHKKTI